MCFYFKEMPAPLDTEDTTVFVDPKHPLPNDLQQMPKDETVCQYCGIPYLVHSEMSKMKRRVAELEHLAELSEVHASQYALNSINELDAQKRTR